MDRERRPPWLMLVDGHEAQSEPIHTCIEPHRVEVTLILLFIYVLDISRRRSGVSMPQAVKKPSGASGSAPCRSSIASRAM